MSRLGNLGARLYRGEVGYDFVAKRKLWYGVSILITITAIVALGVRGLNMGIEFRGGAVFTTPATPVSVAQAQDITEEAAGHGSIVQKLGNGTMRIQVADLDTQQGQRHQGRDRRRPRRLRGEHHRRAGRSQLGRADRQQGVDRPRGLQ